MDDSARSAKCRALWAIAGLVALLIGLGGCPHSSETTPGRGCTATNECAEGQLCIEGTCTPACNSRADCPERHACLAGICQPNLFRECEDLGSCPTGQACFESDGTADAYCGYQPCRGAGLSTCPDPPNFTCQGAVCLPNPFPTCATIAACGVGEQCRESDGLQSARCAPLECEGEGQGTCPHAAFECLAGLCVRHRGGAGWSAVGGSTPPVMSGGNYRLHGMVSAPVGEPSVGARVLTSPSFRLEVGLEP